MSLTHAQIDELVDRAISNRDVAAVKELAAALRPYAKDASLYRITTADGMTRQVTAEQYLAMTATDLVGSKVELVR